jgi:hypothetical protein
MDNPDMPEISESVPKNKKSRKNRGVLAVALILVGVFALGGWLYYDSVQTVRDQKALIKDLQKQLKDLGIDVVGGGGAGDAVVTCNGGSAYSADVGNFSLTLTNPNIVIRNLDGRFEGGTVTQLSVGRCLEGETNVVDNYPTNEVKIHAHPVFNSATLRANLEALQGGPLTPGSTVTIDGVSAQTYTSTGLFNPKFVYFDHGGIGYQIELTDTNATSESILADVISDWSFTP